MSATEFELRKLLEDATFYIKNAVEDETYHEKSKNCLDRADQILLENTRQSFIDLSAEVIVHLAEVSLLSGKRDEQAERILEIFFQRVTQEDQYFCRALLAQSTIEERKIGKQDLKGEANLEQVQYAFSFVQRTIEICTRAENKQKYQFIVYNASIKTWHIIRGLMRPGWSKHLVDILEKVSNLLEEADDSDFNWRCRYLNGLCKALEDGGKKPESLKVLDKLVELTKKKGDCNFQETLFRIRMHMYKDNNGMLGNIKKETETGEDKGGYKALFVIQQVKSGVIPEPQIEKELQLLMSQIAPSSVSEDPAAAQQSQKITPIMQDRIAECGRMAIKYGLISYAEGACSTVARARQGSLRAKVLTEYTKAELLLRKPSAEIDPKTGMKLNTLQRQIEDFEKRVESLKILDRAMIANKKLQDADVTIEGCILIWNIGIPLLKNSARSHIYKPFQAAATALELLEANESQLRVCLHLELAKYEIEQDFLSRASLQLKKALMIDYSEVSRQSQIELTEDDNPDDFARPYDRALKFLLRKLSLKTNLYGGDPDSMHELIILDVENAKTTKNAKMRETLLDKAIKQLIEYEEPEFEVRPEDNLVEEEIQAAQKKFHLNLVRERKERVLIAAEISKLALEEMLVEIAYDAATVCVKDEWDPQKNPDLIIAQSQAHIDLAKVQVEFLLEEEVEIGHSELITLDEDQDEREFTPEQKQKFADQKQAFLDHIIAAVKLGQQARQSWLVFNASIEFWNNYLPIFKLPSFYDKMHPEGQTAMLECFEAMNNCFISAIFSPDAVDYELNKKMLVFSNLSVLLARFFEFKENSAEAIRVCDTLLTKQLPSHLRKTFDSIKARVTKSVSNLAQLNDAKGKKEAAPKGKNVVAEKEPPGPSKTDILTSEVLSYLELIQNGNKEMIQKALDTLNQWQPNEQEEIELELNVELWCRLGRLAISQQTNAMYKVALYCADVAIKNGDEKAKARLYMQIPVTRLRWYAVAEALYGEALYLLLDTQKQEKESQDKLLHASVGHFVESCNIASKAGIAYLVLESAKSMWNAIIGILDAPNNRALLIKPMALVHTYLKAVSENSDPDFLSLFYSALFQCIAEQRNWKQGEKITEEAFTYMPQTHQKVLWEAKMNFLSKLGKNVLSAISNMKESNASLMAKVWVRLARSSSNRLEQHSAYNKAIEILRKEESVEVVEVLIEYSEWMHRHKYDPQDVEDMLLLAVDILMDIEPGWDDEDDELPGEQDDAKTKKTGRSGSSRQSKAMSKAQTRKSNAKSMKKSVAGKSRMSKATMRSKSMRSRSSRVSKKTTTALQKRQEEEGQPLYMNCSHYDKMIRIHSMLAMLAPDAQKQREYALDGHYFIMKMWEQSIFALNATTFFANNAAELAQLGYTADDQVSRREFFSEIINGGDMQIPLEFTLPEKPEDWTSFELPAEYFAKSDEHEDKLMVAKYTFIKPELTFMHIQKVAKLLDQYYFHVQLLPVLQMLQLFAKDVLRDSLAEKTYILQRARVLFNIGLKEPGQALQDKAEADPYELTESERRVNYEKIKALKNPEDDLREGTTIPFGVEDSYEPRVIEMLRTHETWLAYAEELIRWGEFARTKDLAKEVALHARILQDQDSYSRSLLILAQIAYLEGESAQSLRIYMTCHKYAKEIDLVEKAIVDTFNLLFKYEKYEDCEQLLEPSLNMLVSLRSTRETEHNNSSILESKSKQSVGQNSANQVNLPLEFTITTVLILQATLSIKLSQNTKLAKEDREQLILQSFAQAEQFDQQVQVCGFKQEHIRLLLDYTKLLWEEVSQSTVTDMDSVQALKVKLQQCATFLLKSQEYLTNQVFYIGVHQESIRQLNMSLPILRLLGLTKLRIAQVNTTIGVIKSTGQADGTKGSSTDRKKVDKVLATFMDQLTKQIQAQQNTYKKNMNRYEKSISILHSALNLLHPHCEEYPEVQVEIAKNRRLLAMNKNHLRGQWRQDAIQVDKVNMNQIELEEGEDRKDQLEAKGLEGEVNDVFVNYKNEMLRSFVSLVQNQVGSAHDDTKSTLDRILDQIGTRRIDNILGTFATEFAEGRGNLNKEQAFYYLSLFQYAVNRQQLQKIYTDVTTESHPDVGHLRGLELIRELFSYGTSPSLPSVHKRISDELMDKSKPYQILKDVSTLEQMKENLPSSTGFLIMQMADDQHSMYVAYCQVNKERKFQYYVSKLPVPLNKKDELIDMVERLKSMKTSMQKTPITIDEDLEALERESERELQSLILKMQEFFAPVTDAINAMLHPELEEDDDASQNASMVDKKGKPKEDAKKAPPAKPAAKGGKAGAGQPIEVAAYESNIPLTTGGVESVVIMLDQMFESLPIEALQVFQKVPVVTRDFNLHLHLHRLKSVGHKAEMHNNFGINKEELRYIVDIPQNQTLQEQGSAFVQDELAKIMPGSKWEGIMSHSEHIPSEGEWQTSIANASMFMYYSMTCLLHKFPSALVSDLSIFNKCKAMVIFDRMNSYKTLIDRNVLTSKHFSPDEQPLQQAALFTLCDVSSIVVNHWSTRPEDNLEQMQALMRGTLSEGHYLGNYALKKGAQVAARPTSKASNNAESKDRLGSQASQSRTGTAQTTASEAKLSIYKHNMVTVGVPFLRVQ